MTRGSGIQRAVTLWFGLWAALSTVSGAAQVQVTDVLDSGDEDDPFHADVQVRYEFEASSAQLVRERPCSAPSADCPTRSGVTRGRELAWEQVDHRLVITPRIGLYRNLELRLDLPVHLLMQDTLRFDDGVGPANSSVVGSRDGDPNGTGLFVVPFNGPQRAGFGDMSIGLRYAPYDQRREVTDPTWVLGFTYTVPTGEIRKAGNAGVGRGIHTLEFYTAISRRLEGWVEPYARFGGAIRIAGKDSLFEERGGAQTLAKPGNSLGFSLGTVFVPWERDREDTRLEIDAGLGVDYHFEGREYSELFEILAASPCDDDPQCTLTQAGGPLPAGAAAPRTDGITDIASHAVVAAWIGLDYQPWKHIQLGARFTYQHRTAHLISNADPGADRDGDGVVTANGADGNEFSPTYVQALDAPPGDPATGGAPTRFRSQNAHTFGVMLHITGRY